MGFLKLRYFVILKKNEVKKTPKFNNLKKRQRKKIVPSFLPLYYNRQNLVKEFLAKKEEKYHFVIFKTKILKYF
jgi:hypothetical protein